MISKDHLSQLPVEITNQLETETENKAVDWLAFSLDGRVLTVKLESILRLPPEFKAQNPNSNHISIHVVSEAGEVLANFFGEINLDKTKGKATFKSKGFHNKTVTELPDEKIRKNANYVPGVIRATIKELILRGGITEWISAAALLTGGSLTYESLRRDSELYVKKIRLPDYRDGGKCYRYILTKASQTEIILKNFIQRFSK